MKQSVQPLEPRLLLQATFVSGTLTVNGTPDDDSILVRGEPQSVVVEINGTPRSFPADAVKRIVVNGLGGDDLIENATKRPSTLAGGAGRDTLVGGNGNDSLIAGGEEGEIVRPRNGQDRVRIEEGSTVPLIDFTGQSPGRYALSADAYAAQVEHPGGLTTLDAAPGEYFLKARLTDGDDVAHLSAFGVEAVGVGFVSVDLGPGADRIEEILPSSYGLIAVDAGPGADDLRHPAAGGGVFVTLNGGGGNDVIPLFENYDATGGAGFDTVEWEVPAFFDQPQEVRLNLGFERYVFRSEAPLRIIDGDGSRVIDVRDVHPIDRRRVTVLAGGGDDTVIGADGSDVLVGGPGNDVVDYSHCATPIDGRIEFADAEGEFEISRVIAGDEQDELRGFEVLIGTQAADTLFAAAPPGTALRLDGAGGADTLRSDDFGADVTDRASITLTGGGGNDTITADARGSNLTIEGGRGNDALTLSPAQLNPAVAVRIAGGAGRDTLDDARDFVTPGERTADGYARMPEVEVWLAPGEPKLAGSSRDDVIVARRATFDLTPRYVRGGDGDDLIDATRIGGSRSTLRGGGGDDTVLGGPGADLIEGDVGDDSIDGGRGFDRVSGGPGNDTLIGGRDGDNVSGDAGDDLLIGGPRADRLFGGDGNDRFRIAGGGIDTADGGAGDDTLENGDAEDVLISIEALPR